MCGPFLATVLTAGTICTAFGAGAIVATLIWQAKESDDG